MDCPSVPNDHVCSSYVFVFVFLRFGYCVPILLFCATLIQSHPWLMICGITLLVSFDIYNIASISNDHIHLKCRHPVTHTNIISFVQLMYMYGLFCYIIK